MNRSHVIIYIIVHNFRHCEKQLLFHNRTSDIINHMIESMRIPFSTISNYSVVITRRLITNYSLEILKKCQKDDIFHSSFPSVCDTHTYVTNSSILAHSRRLIFFFFFFSFTYSHFYVP